MSQQESASPERRVPYVSFSAFQKLLRRIAEEGGPPDRIDRTYLTGMSGGYQAQILASLRALGLIDAEGSPTQELTVLSRSLDGELQGFMQRSVELLYPEAVELAKRRGSAGQLHEIFRQEYGLSGSTLESAIRFYLDASTFAGVAVSPNFRPPARARARKAAKVTAPSGKAPSTTTVTQHQSAPSMGSMPTSTQRVDLASGGNLVLTMAADVFALSEKDRQFVFEIVDKVRAYRDANRTAVEQDSSQDSLGASSSQDDSAE